MAYELVGIKPKSCFGMCARLNIWKWYEFVRMLKYFDIISENMFPLWMMNDYIILTDEESEELSKKIKTNLNRFDDFIKKLYLEEIPYSFMPWHREVCCPILHKADIKYILLFLDNCGGFRIN